MKIIRYKKKIGMGEKCINCYVFNNYTTSCLLGLVQTDSEFSTQPNEIYCSQQTSQGKGSSANISTSYCG